MSNIFNEYIHEINRREFLGVVKNLETDVENGDMEGVLHPYIVVSSAKVISPSKREKLTGKGGVSALSVHTQSFTFEQYKTSEEEQGIDNIIQQVFADQQEPDSEESFGFPIGFFLGSEVTMYSPTPAQMQALNEGDLSHEDFSAIVKETAEKNPSQKADALCLAGATPRGDIMIYLRFIVRENGEHGEARFMSEQEHEARGLVMPLRFLQTAGLNAGKDQDPDPDNKTGEMIMESISGDAINLLREFFRRSAIVIASQTSVSPPEEDSEKVAERIKRKTGGRWSVKS